MQEKRGGGVSCRRRVWVTEEGIKRWGIRESLCEPLTASARPIEPKGKVTDAYLYMYGHIIAESMLHLRAFKKIGFKQTRFVAACMPVFLDNDRYIPRCTYALAPLVKVWRSLRPLSSSQSNVQSLALSFSTPA